MKVTVELGGGLEGIFENKKVFDVELPGEAALVKDLVEHLRQNYVRGNPEFFYDKGTVRAGILVLVNDADWSLSGEEETELGHRDKVSFISTLHGG